MKIEGGVFVNIRHIKEFVRRVTYCFDSNDPEEIIHNMQIKLGYLPEYADINRIKGCYGMIDGEKFILIHTDLKEEERKEVLAHELGHAILHPSTNALFLATYTYFSLGSLELEADTFASELLLPDNVFEEYIDKTKQYASNCERLPMKFVDLKFKNYGK